MQGIIISYKVKVNLMVSGGGYVLSKVKTFDHYPLVFTLLD